MQLKMDDFISFVECPIPPSRPSIIKDSSRMSSFASSQRSSLRRKSTISGAKFYFSYDYVIGLSAAVVSLLLKEITTAKRRGKRENIRKPSWVEKLLSAGNEFSLAVDYEYPDDGSIFYNDSPLGGNNKVSTPQHVRDSNYFETQLDNIHSTMQDSIAVTHSDSGGKSADVDDVADVFRMLGGITTYCDAQTNLLKILTEESEYLTGIWDSAMDILQDKRREIGKGDRTFYSTAEIVSEINCSPRRTSINKRRESAAYRRGTIQFTHGETSERRRSTSQILSLCRRRSEVRPLPSDTNNRNTDYGTVLKEQADELKQLDRQNETYDTFMNDCLQIQGIMFQSPDEEMAVDEVEVATNIPKPPLGGKKNSRYSRSSIFPVGMRQQCTEVRYDKISAASYRKARSHLVRQLRQAHKKESNMMSQLAAIIGLKEKKVETIDPHRRRSITDNWILVQHLTKQICESENDIREWLADDVGTPSPEQLFINRLESSSLLFFPTYASHAKGGRLLQSYRQLPLRVREVGPCCRCFCAIASVECPTCGTWMCHFCNLLIHQANSLHHQFVDKIQI